MALLSQVFPGLRDFRTPFASGVLWLLLGWLLIEPHVNEAHPHGVYASIRDLNSVLKPLGIGAGIALFAYLVGAIMEVLWAAPLHRLGLVGRGGLSAINAVVAKRLNDLSDEETIVFSLCHSFTAQMFIREYAGGHEPGVELDLADVRAMANTPGMVNRTARYLHADMVRAIRDELDVAATRLLGEKQAQFEIYDRLRSEAEFRIAIAAPVGGLVYILLYTNLSKPLAGVISAIVAGVFVLQARNRRRAAGDRMADFLLVGDVNAPSLDQLKSGRFTFAALDAGEIRLPRETAPGRTSIADSPADGTMLGVPLRVRLASEIVEALEVAVGVVLAALSPIWRGLKFVVRMPPRVARACGFALRDLAWNRGRVLRAAWSLRPGLRAHTTASHIDLGDAYRDSGYYKRAGNAYGAISDNMVAIGRISDLQLELTLRKVILDGLVRWLRDLVDLYAEQGRLETAKSMCETVVARGFPEANIPLGDVLRALDDPMGAEHAYLTAVDGGMFTGLGRLGELMLRQGRDAEAEKVLRRAIDNGAKSAYVPLGDLLWRRQRKADAMAAYRAGHDAGFRTATERLKDSERPGFNV